ncbi:MAG: flagellar hook-basal body complex protein FliE [Phycisphaerae bacterium]
MSDPISRIGMNPAGQILPGAAKRTGESAGGTDFASMMREQLGKVSELQGEADEKVQQLLTGQTQNLTDVFAANQKAKVAFSLLMEVRNKLVEAYQELQNMRV